MQFFYRLAHRSALIIICVGIFGLHQAYQSHAFYRHAQTAQVENIREVRKVETAAGEHYNADVQFTANDGTSHAPHIKVPSETLDKFHFGASLEILYDPEHPDHAKWPGGNPDSHGAGIGILMFGIALLLTTRRK